MKALKSLILVNVLLITLNMLGCGLSQNNASNGKIVFQTDQDRNFDLYIMNLDGSELQNLTNSPPSDTSTNNNIGPVSSPDGRKVAFQSDRDGNNEIYVIDVESRVQFNLTKNNAKDYSPTWSPDGKYIAFVSDRDALLVNADHDIWSSNIYVMDTEGSNTRRLTNENKTAGYNGLSWSSDGLKLTLNLWDSTPYGGYFSRGINLMTLSDSNLTLLASKPYNTNCCAKWSPDGKRIVYSVLGDNFENIYIMNADGSDQVAITKDISIYNTGPSWSPDGKYIIFSSNLDGDFDIYTVKADGTGLTQITNMPGDETSPTWASTP